MHRPGCLSAMPQPCGPQGWCIIKLIQNLIPTNATVSHHIVNEGSIIYTISQGPYKISTKNLSYTYSEKKLKIEFAVSRCWTHIKEKYKLISPVSDMS